MFRKRRKQEEIEEEKPKAVPVKEVKKNPISVPSQDKDEVEDVEPEKRKLADNELTDKYASGTEESIFDRYSSGRTGQGKATDPREYEAYDTTTSPKWIDIQFANGRRVLLSHFDIKRVDSMTPEVLSIFCSDCIVRLEGKHLHSLLQPFEKIHRLRAFDDSKFDSPPENKPIIELIELKEIE